MTPPTDDGPGSSLSALKGMPPVAPLRAEDVPTPLPKARELIGGYQILEELARGGQGIVYKVRDLELGREVALKLSLSAMSLEAEKKFREEANAHAKLTHPHITPVYSFGKHEPRPYFVMELAKGSLAKALADEAAYPKAADAAGVVMQLAEAMHYSHDAGVYHRDLKPQNVLIALDGTAKLADFGLAGARLVGGSLKYMAPEVAIQYLAAKNLPKRETVVSAVPGDDTREQAALDATVAYAGFSPPNQVRIDVYGLGAILHELLTGKPPYEGGTDEDLLADITSKETPPLLGRPKPPSRVPVVPVSLQAIALKCLAHDPEQRYESARAVADDLRRWRASRLTRAYPKTMFARCAWSVGLYYRRLPAAAALWTALVAIFVLLSVGLWRITFIAGKLEEANTGLEESNDELDETNKKLDDRNKELGKANTELEAERKRLREALTESKRQLMERFASKGLEDYDRDARLALAWFAGALREAEASIAQRVQRMRIHGLMQRLPRFQKFLRHGDDFVSASYGGPGKRRIMTRGVRSVKLWDAKTFALLGTFPHPDGVNQVLFRPGRDEVLTTSGDGIVRLWQAGKDAPVGQRKFPEAPNPEAVCFDSSGERVVLKQWIKGGKFEAEALVWDIARDTLGRLPRAPRPVAIGIPDPTGKRVAFYRDRNLFVWNLADLSAAPQAIAVPGTTNIGAARFGNRGERLLVPTGRTVRMYDAKTGRETWAAPVLLQYEMQSASFTTYDEVVNLANAAGSFVYDAATGKSWESGGAGHQSLLYSDLGALSADQRFTLENHWDGVDVVDQAGQMAPAGFVPVPPGNKVRVASFSHDGKRVVMQTDKFNLGVWSLDGPRQELHLKGPFAPAFSPADGALAIANMKKAHLVNPAGKPFADFPVSTFETQSLLFSADGSRLAAVSFDDAIDLFDVKERKTLWNLKVGNTGTLISAALSADGQRLLTTSSEDGRKSLVLRLWDIEGRKLSREVGEVSGPGSFSGDGNRVIAVTGNTATVWEAASGKKLCELAVPGVTNTLFEQASLNHGGTNAVTRSFGGGAHLWDAQDGTMVTALAEGSQHVSHAEFSPDGALVALAFSDGMIGLQGAGTGRMLNQFRASQRGAADRCAFSPDGRKLLVITDGETLARVWEVEGDPRRKNQDIVEIAEFIAGQSVGSGTPKPVVHTPESERAILAKHPEAFSVTPEQALEFHYEETQRAKKLGDPDAVRLHATAVIENAKGRRGDDFIAAFYAMRAEALRELNRLKESEADYREAVRLDPAGTWREQLGYTLQRQGRLGEAVIVYGAKVPLGLNARISHTNRAFCHAQLAAKRRGHWAFVAAHCRTALAAAGTGEDFRLWRQLAVALLLSGDTEGYIRVRRDLIDRFAKTANAYDAEQILRIWSFLPPKLGEDLGGLAPLIKEAGALLDGNARFLLTFGAWALHAKPEFAMPCVKAAIKADGGREKADAEALALLAICEARHGRRIEAGIALAEGWIKWGHDFADRQPNGTTRLAWEILRHRQLLLREANAALWRGRVP